MFRRWAGISPKRFVQYRTAEVVKRLLRERRFGPFFATQFLGALNDNVLKNALVIAFTYQAGAWSARGGCAGRRSRARSRPP